MKNTGTMPITLSMTATSWGPNYADDYLTISWDQQGTVLDVDDSVSATLTLTADTDTGDLADFSFDIVIIGAE